MVVLSCLDPVMLGVAMWLALAKEMRVNVVSLSGGNFKSQWRICHIPDFCLSDHGSMWYSVILNSWKYVVNSLCAGLWWKECEWETDLCCLSHWVYMIAVQAHQTTTCGPVACFDKILLERREDICFCVVCVCVHATTELTNYNRDHMACQLKIFTITL